MSSAIEKINQIHSANSEKAELLDKYMPKDETEEKPKPKKKSVISKLKEKIKKTSLRKAFIDASPYGVYKNLTK